jgi:hypothetical protein
MTATFTTPDDARKAAKKRANTEGRPMTIFRIARTWYALAADEPKPKGMRPTDVEKIFPDPPPTEGGWPIE